MKELFHTRMKSVLLLGMSMGLISLTSCDDYKFHDNTTWDNETLYFDFSTSSEVNLHINYGQSAAHALLCIYDGEPKFNESQELVNEPVYKIFADANGRVNQKVTLPNGIKEVYVYSPSWNAPQMVKGEVKLGALDINLESTTPANAPATRAAQEEGTYKMVEFAGSNVSGLNYKGIVGYSNRYGKIDDINHLVTKESTDATVLQNLQCFLWNGHAEKPYGLDNSRFAAETNVVNTGVAYSYVNGEGQTVTVDGANVSLVYMTEKGWYESVIGYYYYPTDQVPTSPNDLTLYLAIPNVSIAYGVPYGVDGKGYTHPADCAPIAANTKIDLLYEDKDGNISKTFPSGYTIGYFILPDGFVSTSDNGSINWNKTPYYSNKEWNSDKSSHFISLNTSMGVVYGIEDGGDDRSFEDVLFLIDANPIETIQNPNRPTVEVSGADQESGTPVEFEATEVRYKNYAYEDHWPEKSDYDMNDVIIRHSREIVFGENNKVKKVTDVFTPVQPAGSATRVDAFAVQYTTRGDVMTLPEGVVDETSTKSVILFNDAKSHRNQNYTVVREFTSGNVLKTEVEKEDLNPFIILDYQAGMSVRTEVHLPKHSATDKADQEQLKKADNIFFVSGDGEYPYAIELPVKDFQPVTECVNIGEEYIHFNAWADSKGAQYTDWYKYYEKK